MANDVLVLERTGRAAQSSRAKPTPEFITNLETTLRSHFKEQDEQIRIARLVRERKESIPLPKHLERIKGMEMHDPAVGDEIKRIVSSVNSRPPKCIVVAADPESDTGQANATLRENWTEQVLYEAGTQTNGQNAYEQNIDACFGDGGAWCKLIYDRHRWEEVWNVPDSQDFWLDAQTGEEATDDTPATRLQKGKKPKSASQYLQDREDAKKGCGVPFRLKNVDVATVYPLWRGDDLVSVLEITERPTIELMEAYGVRPPANQRDVVHGPSLSEDEAAQYSSKTRFLEYWTSHFCVYMVAWPGQGAGDSGGETEVVRIIRHGYGQVPYFFAPGIMFNYWRGRKVGEGIAQDWLELARYRQFLWNLVVTIAAQSAGAPMAHTRPEAGEPLLPDSDLPEGEVQLVQLAGVYEMQPGEKFEVIKMPGVPEPMKDLLQIVNNMIERLQTPRVNAIGTDMSGAGFAYAQIFAEIKVSYDVFIKHLEEMYVKLTRFLWKLMRNVVQEPVPVHYTPSDPKSNKGRAVWLTAGPDDLTDAVGLKWRINADPPTAEIVLSRQWGERLQQKTASLDMAIEAMGGNPEEVRRGQLMDQMRQEPEYKHLLKEQILQGLDRGDLLKKAAVMAVQSGLAPGLPPDIAAQVMQQHIGAPMGGPGMAPGAPMMPDQGALAMAPQGQGAAPMPNPYAAAGGPPGPVPGGAQFHLPPTAGMQAGLPVQALR